MVIIRKIIKIDSFDTNCDNRIIFMIEPMKLGDAVYASKLIKELADRGIWQSKRCQVLTPRANASLILEIAGTIKCNTELAFTWMYRYNFNSIIDFFIDVRKLKLILKNEEMDILFIDTRGDIRVFLLLLLSGAQSIIGSSRSFPQFYYDNPIKKELSDHFANTYLELAAYWNLKSEFLQPIHLVERSAGSTNAVVLAIGAGNALRIPTITSLCSILDEYVAHTSTVYISTADLPDSFLHSLVDAITKSSRRVVTITFEINKFIDFLKESDLVVCSDSSIQHICSVYDIPFVSIYGPSDSNFTKPLFLNKHSSVENNQKSPRCWPCSGIHCTNSQVKVCYK